MTALRSVDEWLVLVKPQPGRPVRPARPVRRHRVVVQVIVAAVVVIVAVGVAGVVAARKLAEAEAVTDAGKTADLLGELLVQPALTDGVLTGQTAALTALDATVRTQILTQPSIVRVKLWDPTGRILYSDEPRLVGVQFALHDEERDVLTAPRLEAEVSDLSSAENVYERDAGKLLEAYRPVWTPSGQPLLFEVYFRYDEVTARSGQLWRGFAGITVSSLLIMLVLLLPILWRLLDRITDAQRERLNLLQRTVDASTQERRRIAGSLHDGPVQDLVAASLAVAGAAARATAAGRADLARDLESAGATVRTSISGLRSLLVDLYPPSLSEAGLPAALHDLAAGLGGRGIRVSVDVPAAGIDPEQQRAVYRITQECLANVLRHAQASAVSVVLRPEGRDLVLEISDDGVGFDGARAVQRPHEGHFGLQILTDLARDAGAGLRLATAPAAGTRWQVRWAV